MRHHDIKDERNWGKGIIALLVFLMILLFIIGTAGAHKAMIFAWVDGDTVCTESKFSGGRKVKGGEVIVYDLDGNQLLKGKTNELGEFAFKVPKKGGMKIVLVAGMGHRGEWIIPPDEIQNVAAQKTGTAAPQKTATEEPEQQVRSVPMSGVSLDEIRIAVEKALDKRLEPVMKMLAESREQGPSLSDIFGGIGYILGLMGIGVYFNYRRKSAEAKPKKADESA